jgi:antitoxin component YwqK of YwqJK toxin-antitoxin module
MKTPAYGRMWMMKTKRHKPQSIDDQGLTIKYHANGKTVWSKGRIVSGNPEGYWQWYRLDGTLKRTGHFLKGEPTGEWITYDAKGKPYKVTKERRNQDGKK